MYEQLFARLGEVSGQVGETLEKLLSRPDFVPTVGESMRYTALAGGKRIRPFLTVTVAEMLAPEDRKQEVREAALRLGAALEMIHCYSLIHDDLPCMDNDEMRRGKPSNHIIYGEAGAVLAGDGLLTEAFFAAANAPLSDAGRVQAVNLLSSAAGAGGMVGGQSLDLENEGKPITAGELEEINSKKTGALITCAGLLGCVAAGEAATGDAAKKIGTYCDHIGKSFQLIDDLLDATGDAATLGKNVRVDAQNEKTTFVKLLGIEGCLRKAEALTAAALDAIGSYRGEAAELLRELARYLLERKT